MKVFQSFLLDFGKGKFARLLACQLAACVPNKPAKKTAKKIEQGKRQKDIAPDRASLDCAYEGKDRDGKGEVIEPDGLHTVVNRVIDRKVTGEAYDTS